MEIKVTSITEPQTVAKGKNNWQEIEVEYTNNKGKGKKKLRDFADPDCFKFFSGLVQVGDTVDVSIKKEGDYWNWKSASVMETGTVATSSAGKGSTGASGSGKKGDWETSEERAAKQRYIVRQSSISNALVVLGPGSDLEDILDLAFKLENWVFRPVLDNQATQVKKAVGRPKKISEEDNNGEPEEIS